VLDYGMYLAALEAASASFDERVSQRSTQLKRQGPTAVNLAWALARQLRLFRTRKHADEKSL